MGNDFDETFLSIDGESAATFEKIFMKYQPILLYFINGFIKNLETSKDICQNIFFMLWRDRKNLTCGFDILYYLCNLIDAAAAFWRCRGVFLFHDGTEKISYVNTKKKTI